jgi:hypothetical protein
MQSSTGIRVETTKYVEIRNKPNPLTEKLKLESEIFYPKTLLLNVYKEAICKEVNQ